LNTVIKRLEQALMAVAVGIIILVMLIVAYDAFSRYAFNAPLPWAFEGIKYYLLVTLTYFAVSSTFQHGDHIGVDLFYNMVAPQTRRVFGLISATLMLVLFAAITWGTLQVVGTQFERGAIVPGYFALPAWLSYLPVALGSALMCARLITHIVALLRHGHDPDVVEHSEEV